MRNIKYCTQSDNMYINQQDAQNSCDWTLFSIYVLHVSDCISPSSGANFYKLYVVFGVCGYVWLLCCYNHTTARRMVRAYTKYDVQLVKLLLMMD